MIFFEKLIVKYENLNFTQTSQLFSSAYLWTQFIIPTEDWLQRTADLSIILFLVPNTDGIENQTLPTKYWKYRLFLWIYTTFEYYINMWEITILDKPNMGIDLKHT